MRLSYIVKSNGLPEHKVFGIINLGNGTLLTNAEAINKKAVEENLNYRIKQITSKPEYDWVGSEWRESEVIEQLEDIKKELLGD